MSAPRPPNPVEGGCCDPYAALAELVALKEMKARIKLGNPDAPAMLSVLKRDYAARKSVAWATARSALAQRAEPEAAWRSLKHRSSWVDAVACADFAPMTGKVILDACVVLEVNSLVERSIGGRCASGDFPYAKPEPQRFPSQSEQPLAAALNQCAPPSPAPQPDTVPWPVVTRYSGGAAPEGLHSRVWVRLSDDGPDVEYVPAPQAQHVSGAADPVGHPAGEQTGPVSAAPTYKPEHVRAADELAQLEPLSDAEIDEIILRLMDTTGASLRNVARAIERAVTERLRKQS